MKLDNMLAIQAVNQVRSIIHVCPHICSFSPLETYSLQQYTLLSECPPQ